MKRPLVRVTLKGKRSDHARRMVFFRDQGVENRCSECGDSAWQSLSERQANAIENALIDALVQLKNLTNRYSTHNTSSNKTDSN